MTLKFSEAQDYFIIDANQFNYQITLKLQPALSRNVIYLLGQLRRKG